ncbi:cytochrome c peroxidase [Chryseobacterium gambrini]|uniref:Cytochrome c peroxidase n=1 Tax=Chryseobacterium gambrini TaxID=373672 RepID=A0AAJ1R1H7_9FLAO|nr:MULTISPECIES: cytochrome c peroxidase [Chryseobacterium]MDN4012116.1 cytochrome c peroxidase [Chryseobacterium gambrini]MDN4029634.1 cytochrome c peroxidase [Chryseobacterium gambrini]QWA37062.1 cytochrome-c peroxidase [Chryseobacterium sp. ZHDP1]
MLRTIIILLFLAAVFSCTDKGHQTFENKLRTTVLKKIDTLSNTLTELEGTRSQKELILNFKKARKEYKEIEPFVEYYFQGLSRRINGPALPEIKTDDNIVNDAAGFQVIEEIIFNDPTNRNELKKQINILKTDLKFVHQNFKDLPIQNHHFYELMQHQIIRIATLGVTGFDSPVAFNSMNEAKDGIKGIEEFYTLYCETNKQEINPRLIESFEKAGQYINKNSDFNTFNRLEFIKNHLMPMSVAFEHEFKTIIEQTPHFKDNKVFYGHLSDLMQGKKLNPDAFSPYAASKSTVEKTALGKILFNDVNLSRNNKMSCATCHNAEYAFTDGKKTSVVNIHSNNIRRNSPTLLYSSFQKSFFYDMRSQDLENQIESVMKNPDEFNLSPKEIKDKITTDKNLVQLFKKAFPDKKEITPYEIRNAIASYVRSLMPFSAKIDRYFSGKAALTESEENGFNLFAGKAKCATCHFIPVYNGTVPPWFNNSESEVIGVPENIAWKNAAIDDDEGRYGLNKIEQLQFSFKTPTVRNVEKTSPYMHNGVYKTLEEVIEFYRLGGGNGIGMKLKYQTLPFENLKLTEKEKRDIISFLRTLSDEKK